MLEYLANKNTREGNLLVKARDAICGADMYDRHRLEEYVIGYYMMSVVGYRIPLGRYLAAAKMLEEYGLAEDEYIVEVASNMRVYREVEELIGRTDLLDDSKAEALGVYLELISSPSLKNIILWDFINTPDSYWPLLRDAGIQMMHELVSVIDPGADFNSLVGNFLGIEKTNTLSFFAELIEVANQGISGFEPKTVATSAQDLAEILTLLWGQIIENIPVVNDNLSEYYSMDVGEAELVDFLVNVASGCPDLSCLHELFGNAILQTNLMYLEKQLQKDPMFLIKNCGGENIDPDDYSHLFNHSLPQSCMDRLNNLGSDFYYQDLDNAHTPTINLDHFSVEINQIPDFDQDGNPDDVGVLFQKIRENFLDLASGNKDGFQSNCTIGGNPDIWWQFQDYPGFDPSSSDQWLGTDPVSTIFFIDAGAEGFANLFADPGAVIVSDLTECCWIFSTIATPGSKSQPFSGHRQFGLRTNENGNLEFFTRAVDRVKLPPFMRILINDACSFEDYYDIGYETWSNLTTEVQQFVGDNGGQADLHRWDFIRPDYKELLNQLKTNLPVDINCN